MMAGNKVSVAHSVIITCKRIANFYCVLEEYTRGYNGFGYPCNVSTKFSAIYILKSLGLNVLSAKNGKN